MTLRFQKRIRILPGVHLCLSKGGISLSVGWGPFTVNIGSKAVTTTATIPGTGISDRTRIALPKPPQEKLYGIDQEDRV